MTILLNDLLQVVHYIDYVLVYGAHRLHIIPVIIFHIILIIVPLTSCGFVDKFMGAFSLCERHAEQSLGTKAY